MGCSSNILQYVFIVELWIENSDKIIQLQLFRLEW